MTAIDVTLSFETVTCCHAGCGLTFAVPSWWESKRREDHAWWYCPNGHSQHFPGETKAEKLAKQLAQEKHLREQETARLRERAERAERSAVASRGHVTRIKNRVGKGVCPCCNRTFQDLGRHMKGKHPEWSGAHHQNEEAR